MKKNIFTIVLLCFVFSNLQSQTTTVTSLTANGAGNTYEDINAKLAPNGGDVVESPGITPSGTCTNHDDFNNGESTDVNRHIQEVVDPVMGDVFKFTIHVDEDIDRDKCSTTDRQRNEIKTYASSPDYLLGVIGETVEYKWSFKIPTGFQSSGSFTHIHQLKSVGGISAEESIPLITLTIYQKTSGHELYIRHAASTSQSNVGGTVEISDLEDNWVEVIETVTYGHAGEGSYAITITDIDTQETFLNYSNNTLGFYKTDADFIRPKWGIYRSLNDAAALRDEEILFGSFTITETTSVLSNDDFSSEKLDATIYPNPSSGDIYLPFSNSESASYGLKIFDITGKLIKEQKKLDSNTFGIGDLDPNIYYLRLTNTKQQIFSTQRIIKE